MRAECGNEGGGHLLFHDEKDFLVFLELAEGSGVNGDEWRLRGDGGKG
jgi:hypothetical protein